MMENLFDGTHDVSKDNVIKKMKYYIDLANKGQEIFETDKEECLSIAKQIRSELEQEYKHNNLKKIGGLYKDNKWFNHYSPAVHESIASITGKLTQKNIYSFLYDVDSYMSYYLPK